MTSFSWLLVHYLKWTDPWILMFFHELQAITNVFILILELSQIWPVGVSSRECLEKQVQRALQKVQNEIQGKMASAFPCAFLHDWMRA